MGGIKGCRGSEGKRLIFANRESAGERGTQKSAIGGNRRGEIASEGKQNGGVHRMWLLTGEKGSHEMSQINGMSHFY